MIRVLFIAHFFPPIGGGGVQRSVKFVKHLPSFGILPLVLTVDTKTGVRWSPEDKSLLAEISDQIPIFRAADRGATDSTRENRKRRDRDRLRALFELGDRVIREFKPHLILVSMSPFQDSQVAVQLSKRHCIPWVADLRDPWALDEFAVYESAVHRGLDRRKMYASLRSASLIIMNTPEAQARLRQAFPRLGAAKTACITNGYDAEDFESSVEKPEPDRFIVVHSGHLHTDLGLHQKTHGFYYRALGRLERGVELLPRSHYYLLEALSKWLSEDPSIKHRVRLVFVGVQSAQDIGLAKKSFFDGMVHFTNYIPHSDCLRWVRTADLLFLPLHKPPKGKKATIVPGKTYEYMASGRPILGALPDGDAKDFILGCGTGQVCSPDDPDAMLEIMKKRFEKWKDGAGLDHSNIDYVKMFERKEQARSLAHNLKEILGVRSEEQ